MVVHSARCWPPPGRQGHLHYHDDDGDDHDDHDDDDGKFSRSEIMMLMIKFTIISLRSCREAKNRGCSLLGFVF